MNIKVVNYISNATDNVINQAGNSNQLQIAVPSGLSAQEAGIALLKSLQAGDTFSGEITNITQNEITLMLSNQVSISATLSDALSYNIGDVASFSIKQNNGDKIILKSNENPNMKNLMNEQTITTALRNANVTVNETTVSLVDNLMKHNMPIDSKTINTQLNLLDRTPNATVEDVVLLTKMDIPVTAENVEAFHNYQDFSKGISEQINNMSDSLHGALMEMETSDAANILKEVINSYSETISVPENLSSAIPEKSVVVLKEQLNNIIVNQEGNNTQLQSLIKNIPDNITAKDFLKELTLVLTEGNINETAAKELMAGKPFKEIIDNFLRQELYIEPKDINQESVKKLFAKILRDNETISGKLQNNPQLNEFLHNSNTVSNNVEFMNQINHFMNFVQIPLKMTGQNAHGDLYVYKNGKSTNWDEKEEFKAFLHLDMDNLGPLDVLVTLKQNNVTTNFKVESDAILDFIETHIDELNMALNKLGYNVDAKVELNNTPYTFNNTVIAKELPVSDIKRFSFDVRA